MDGAELLNSGLVVLRLLWALVWLVVPGLLASLLILPARTALPTRLIWGFGGSVLLYSLGALLLNATTRIDSLGWAMLLLAGAVITTAITATMGRKRRRALATVDPASARHAQHGLPALLRIVQPQLPALLIAVLLALLAFGMARSGLEDAAQPRTELWVESRDGRVQVSVLNQEGLPGSYRIEISTPHASEPVAVRHIDRLASGRQQQLDFQPAPGVEALLVTLYRNDLQRPYRHVSISLRPSAFQSSPPSRP